MREKSTTVFESSSTTDQSPALKPSFTKHRKGKRITWWHLMFSPILMRGSWWTHTYPFWGFILKTSMYRTNFTAWVFKRITLKNGDAIASSHLSLLLSILNLITSKKMAQQNIPYLSPHLLQPKWQPVPERFPWKPETLLSTVSTKNWDACPAAKGWQKFVNKHDRNTVGQFIHLT